jgi:hypothetical protein
MVRLLRKGLCKDNLTQYSEKMDRVLSRFALVLLCCVCCVTIGCASASIQKGSRSYSYGSTKKKVAVVPSPNVLNESSWSIIIAGVLARHHSIPVASYLETELIGLDMYTVVERGQLETVLNEHSLSLSGLVEKGDYKTIGRLTGLDAIILVKEGMAGFVYFFLIGHFGDSATAKMIDVSSGERIWSAEGGLTWTTIIPLLPWGLNSERAIAKAIANEIKAQK